MHMLQGNLGARPANVGNCPLVILICVTQIDFIVLAGYLKLCLMF